ncbi:MAG: winged helix domain-containing protein [Oceanicaulis sp.]
MSEHMKNPGALAGATGAGLPSMDTAGTPSVTETKPKRQRRRVQYIVIPHESGRPFKVTATGRELWTLERLAEAGAQGITPRERPAPRWSAYVHGLRRAGVPIDTRDEEHGGDFPGRHGRYILRADLRRVEAS